MSGADSPSVGRVKSGASSPTAKCTDGCGRAAAVWSLWSPALGDETAFFGFGALTLGAFRVATLGAGVALAALSRVWTLLTAFFAFFLPLTGVAALVFGLALAAAGRLLAGLALAAGFAFAFAFALALTAVFTLAFTLVFAPVFTLVCAFFAFGLAFFAATFGVFFALGLALATVFVFFLCFVALAIRELPSGVGRRRVTRES